MTDPDTSTFPSRQTRSLSLPRRLVVHAVLVSGEGSKSVTARLVDGPGSQTTAAFVISCPRK